MQYRPITSLSLPKYLMQELERIQKRAMSIICPGVSYHEALVIMNFKELATHHDEICESLFTQLQMKTITAFIGYYLHRKNLLIH